MHVRLIDTASRRDVRRFVQFPFDLYRDTPDWCPPIRLDLYSIMNKKKHPLYRDSDADFFIAEERGSVVGRVGVLHHSGFSRHKGRECAFFNYFDVVDNPAVSCALFDAVFAWCRERGIVFIEGPTGFTRSDSKGLLVEGFEFRAPVGVNYNHAYYANHILAAGFEKHVDYISGHINSRTDPIDQRVHIIADKLKSRGKFEVVRFSSKKEMRAYLPDLYRVNIEAFQDAPEFVPYGEEEFMAMANDLLAIVEPGLPKLIKAEGRVIGFVIAYPDISDGIRKASGRVFPFGWYHLLRARKTTTNLVLNGVGIIPKYQGSGANAVLYSEMDKIRTEYPQFLTADNLQVADYNLRSFADMSSVGTHWAITHRVYKKELQEK
ncbi:MAG: hypothetical protein HPY85_11530 [Anaerolineae bacterium]|nr:hypothetical protein [Anaerolineae bacterium]